MNQAVFLRLLRELIEGDEQMDARLDGAAAAAGESVKVTVLIATRNRSEGLRRTLESLFSESNLARDDWEAMVVFDDGARDGSREVCEIFEKMYPRHFRHFAQAREGKSNALNLGISMARGEVLALTDDDVICAPDYIASAVAVFEQYPVDIAQGRVVLESEGGLPEWMSARLREFMSETDQGERVLLPFDQHINGTNMIVRRAAACAVGGFAPELGAGTRIGFAEDTEFSLVLRRAGYRTMYAPQIVVRHQLPRRRLTRSFFRKRYFRLGRADAFYLPCDISVWKHGRYAVKEAFLNELKAMRCRYRGRLADSLDFQCMVRWRIGLALQYCLFHCGVSHRLPRATAWLEPAGAPQAGVGRPPGGDPARRRTANCASVDSVESHSSGSPL